MASCLAVAHKIGASINAGLFYDNIIGMKNIYFVRHGESRSNASGILEGDDSPLTEKGIEQAKTIARRVMEIETDALISSTMLRARQTSDEISKLKNLPVELSDLLVERKKPDCFYGMDRKSERYLKLSEAHERNILESDLASGGETFEDIMSRADKALEMLKRHKGDNIIAVTHGAFLRAVILRMIWKDMATNEGLFRFLYSSKANNTGITHIIYDDADRYHEISGGWILVSWNDKSHL